ncbi:MAG: hypothetical protein AVDCRST_MAG10-144 [uncultured Acidimicrobiales bacterium]|uniref:DUF2207 domain-containing protein n=1 Tax=uncultured Acidimicrobiales bacterium TaxID=310071 RepID=A0A6J4H2P2_9ACTN|nr:MAG: hypothetical protein AVDCRST_MAG10-144 [uncultured Acidimicrobiales bacterium]
MSRPRAAASLLAVIGLAVLILLGLGLGPADAQAGTERITGYNVEIQVEATGSMLVTETIDYDFASNNRHGIFREIPVRTGYDDRYERIFPLKVISVTGSEGTPDEYESETAGSYKRLKIGDPDKEITGAHRYTIVYRVDAALNGFPEHDELYWNAIGTEWNVPIERAAVRVTTPSDITQVACFGGGSGSRLPCSEADGAGRIAGFSQGGLGQGEGVTVVVGFAKGAVPEPVPVLDERWSFRRAFAATPATVGISVALLAALLFGVLRLAWRTGRDRRYAGSPVDTAFATSGQEEAVRPSFGPFGAEETPVEFVPPDGLRPGQVGTLVDEAANTLDVTATIVDLAVRGYLRIDEIPKKGFFGKPDWDLTKLKEGGDLRPYERELLDGLFKGGDEVKLSALRNTFAERLKKVQEALYDDVVGQGWFVGRPDKVRLRWQVIGAIAVVLAIAVVVGLAAFTRAGLVGIPLVVGAIALLASAKRMPRRTAKGTGVLRRAEGFRRFIDESEKDRARFAEQQHLFSEYLPYAIVFGATEKWARAFAGLDGELPQPGWYGGSSHFTAAGFSSSIDGFAVTTAGTITSTPAGSGSSGFSGGGFSGGGGGGGGGGSW